MLGLPATVHACLFDLDGVLTDTASVHAAAWKATFDAYLERRALRTGEAFVPFDTATDYPRHVDGKKREDGVRSFLQSRGIEMPQGNSTDPADAETIYGLGNAKNEMFRQVLRDQGITVFEGSRRYLEAVAAAGLGIAVVSASANTADVLARTGLDAFAEQRVDGVTLREENIPGKPAPDSYLRAAELLGVAPAAAAVFEDALSGVQAGQAGHFGLVIGVNRTGGTAYADDLRRSGADVVVTDLADLLDAPAGQQL